MQRAEVGRQPEPRPLQQGRCSPLITPQGEHHRCAAALRQRRGQAQGLRPIAAGAAQQHRPVLDHLEDGIVEDPGDGPVVHEQRIGQAAVSRPPQPLQGLMRIGEHRLAAAIAARGHQRRAMGRRQQVVQGRGRQHHPQGWTVRGDGGPGIIPGWTTVT